MTELEADSFLNRKFFYKLDGKKPVNCNFWEYAEAQQKQDWVLRKSTPIANVEVSTVFLGFNMNFMSKEPVVFETMIFGGKYNKQITRRKFYDDALRDHEEWCLKIIDNE